MAVSIILFEIIFSGRSVQKATTSMIKEMIENRHIENLVVVNRNRLRYILMLLQSSQGNILISKTGGGMGLQVPKPHFTYNIGDISNFEPFILEAQKNAGYTDKELIYPDILP
jgi:hypothetical protein